MYHGDSSMFPNKMDYYKSYVIRDAFIIVGVGLCCLQYNISTVHFCLGVEPSSTIDLETRKG